MTRTRTSCSTPSVQMSSAKEDPLEPPLSPTWHYSLPEFTTSRT